MKRLLCISLCLMSIALGSNIACSQETDELKEREQELQQREQAIADARRFVLRSDTLGSLERLNVFTQSLETMARHLDHLERMGKELEVEGFSEMAQSAEAFFKSAKPFIERLEAASKDRSESKSPQTLTKAVEETLKTGEYLKARAAAQEDAVRKLIQQKMQSQQGAMMKAAMEYYVAQQLAAKTEAKEGMGLLQKVVGDEATTRMTGIEERLTRLEGMLEKVLSKLDDDQP